MNSPTDPGFVQLLTPDGRRVEHPDFSYSGDDASIAAHLRAMVLARLGRPLVAFEIDERLRRVHDVLLAGDSLGRRIEVRYEDALNADWSTLVNADETPVLVGNLPYLRSTDTVLKLV